MTNSPKAPVRFGDPYQAETDRAPRLLFDKHDDTPIFDSAKQARKKQMDLEWEEMQRRLKDETDPTVSKVYEYRGFVFKSHQPHLFFKVHHAIDGGAMPAELTVGVYNGLTSVQRAIDEALAKQTTPAKKEGKK